VAVARSSELLARLVERFGKPIEPLMPGVHYLFPTPAALVDVNMDTLGLGQKQHEALRQLASLSLVYRH